MVNDDFFTGLLNLASKKDLVANKVHLMEVKDQIELADSFEVGIECFDKQVYCLQHGKLIIVEITADGEVEASVAPVDYLVRAKLNEVGLFDITAYD